MGRPCSICSHPQRTEIECDVLNNVPYRTISEKYQVGRTPIKRHFDNGHIAKELAEVVKMKNLAFSDDVLHKIMFLQNESLQILREAKESKTLGYALNAIGKTTQLVETEAKLAGQIEGININIFLNPKWIELKQQIFAVLKKHPAALNELAPVMEKVLIDESQS